MKEKVDFILTVGEKQILIQPETTDTKNSEALVKAYAEQIVELDSDNC